MTIASGKASAISASSFFGSKSPRLSPNSTRWVCSSAHLLPPIYFDALFYTSSFQALRTERKVRGIQKTTMLHGQEVPCPASSKDIRYTTLHHETCQPNSCSFCQSLTQAPRPLLLLPKLYLCCSCRFTRFSFFSFLSTRSFPRASS